MKYEDFKKAAEGGSEKAEKSLDYLRDFYLNSSSVLRDCAHQYDMETVKHLALINSAGIGAAVALLSANPNKSTILLQISAALFGIGLLLAVIVMFSASQLLFFAAKQVMRQWNEFAQNKIDIAELSIESAAKNRWANTNTFLGFFSLALFLIGITCCVVFAAQKT